MRMMFLIMIGLSLLQADYIRDDTKEVVLDTTTNLMWQDDTYTRTITKNWSDAISYCDIKTLGDFSDWRLPNKNELYLLADRNISSPALSSSFQNVVSSDYWSSTTYVDFPTRAWVINFANGTGNSLTRTSTGYIRCVR